jgi:hypothetical protein
LVGASIIFNHAKHADGAIGALRTASFRSDQISAVSADHPPAAAGESQDGSGLCHWLASHLTRHGLEHEQAEHYHAIMLEGRVLVTMAVESDEQAEEARNLLESAGAAEISRAADGTMLALRVSADPLGARVSSSQIGTDL